jgi:hypothetical protein
MNHNPRHDRALRKLDVLEQTDARIRGTVRAGGLLIRTQRPPAPVRTLPPKVTPPVVTAPAPTAPERPRQVWGTMPTLGQLADQRHAAMQTAPTKAFIPIDGTGRMSIHDQQQFRLKQAQAKQAATTARAAVTDASRTARWV